MAVDVRISAAINLLEHVRQDSRVPGELRGQADAWLVTHGSDDHRPSVLDAADYGPTPEPSRDPAYQGESS